MPVTKMNLPLSAETHGAILEEARRRRWPATRLVRTIVDGWLAEQKRVRLASEIREFAQHYGGSEVDLAPVVESAALAELRRLDDDAAR